MPAGLSPSSLDNLHSLPPEEVIFGNSLAMEDLRSNLHNIANADTPVLIEGETGTGKDIIARLIHNLSPLKHGPFSRLNCPTIPVNLLESELFGYERGAFNRDYGTKLGRIELADKGSLFLDEIGELPSYLQGKLLQWLQDGQFCRIAGETDRKVQARVICATNRVLEREVAKGTFRQDLFYRINVMKVRVPPLRARIADVPVLMKYFADLYSAKYNVGARQLSGEMIAAFQRYVWPGNVRELENCMRRFVVLGNAKGLIEEMQVQKLDPLGVRDFVYDGSMSLKAMSRQLETKIILEALRAHKWNRKSAAKALNISYRAIFYKLKDAGLLREDLIEWG